MNCIEVEQRNGVAHIRLKGPQRRNAEIPAM